MYFSLVIFFISSACVRSNQIEEVYCDPPDFPQNGGYGPLGYAYTPGDIIRYYCDTNYFIRGNSRRECRDDGKWTNLDIPFCDPPGVFTDADQTSTAEPDYRNEAYEAIDGYKYSCSSTNAGPNQEWTGTFKDVSQVIQIRLFLPIGQFAYDTFIVKEDGSEFYCGGRSGEKERLEWAIHNCQEYNNANAVALKIKSTSPDIPLRICEVLTHGITHPYCNDPRLKVENGRLRIGRKKAQLECLPGYTESTNDSVINCLRSWDTWEKKPLHCMRSDTERNAAADSLCG